MRSLSLVALVSAGAVGVSAADPATTTVKVFLPYADPQPLVGSVVDVDGDHTTMAIGCPPGTDSNDCGLEGSQTVMQGDKTWSQVLTHTDTDGSRFQGIGCVLDLEKDSASCKVAIDEVYSASTFHRSQAADTTGISEFFQPVTLTAGLDKLKGAGPKPTATDSPASSTKSDEKPTSTGAQKSDKDNAAGPMATQNAILAGAAALVGGIVAL